MKLLKNITTAIAAVCLSVSPALARVEDGTSDLLKTLSDNGIHITFNSPNCDGTHYGVYRFVGLKREMHLCPGNSVDAVDHSTVRHESVHAIQHCVNVARGTASNAPIADIPKLVELVNENLSLDTVDYVKSTYPEEHWGVELEANLLELIMSADDIKELFLKACVGGNL